MEHIVIDSYYVLIMIRLLLSIIIIIKTAFETFRQTQNC